MEILSDSKWITCTSAERALKQYKFLLADSNLKCKFSEFSMNEQRLDEFYHDTFDQFNQSCEDSKAAIKLISILSHGNARVGSGFSINKEILEVNLMEQSLVAQRIVHEEIFKEGGVMKADINKMMMEDVKKAWRYAEADAEERRKSQTEGEKKRQQRKRISKEIHEVEAAKKVAIDSAKNVANKYDDKLQELKERLKK